ncbi:hypothetical protein FO519_007502 [Halicephalobus sp. NKZ332]|nr:hypothetical protein FO519_007502 [Halicephalobus sp. NKZ332]
MFQNGNVVDLSRMDWICRFCTFQNNPNNALCQMCGSENTLNRRGKSTVTLPKLPNMSRSNQNGFGFLGSAMNFIDNVINNRTTETGYAQVISAWICPKCQLQNSLATSTCTRCNFYKENYTRSGWTCQGCHLYQPIAPIDFTCPLCKRKAPRVVVHSATAPALQAPRPSTPTQFTFSVTENSREVDKVYNNIMEFCKTNKQSFIDDSFPHSNKSIGDLSKLGRKSVQIVWLRPEKIYTKDGRTSPWRIFHNPHPTDIEQGLLGNCWFLSSLAVIAERREILEQIVLTKTYNEYGVYKIRLCVDGIWETVFVDDFFPCHATSHSMIFAVGRKNQLWVSLIEKALAKIYGNYAALRAGRTVEGLSILTGAPCEHIDIEVDLKSTPSETSAALELIWARLLSAKEANFLMGCSCGAGKRVVVDEEYQKLGLMTKHAYSILDVKQYDKYRLLRIRNPWGAYVWNGEWSPSWNGWRDERIKRDLDYYTMKKETGTFWMPFERFVKYFDSVEVAHVKEGLGWTSQRFPLDLSWKNPKILKLTVFEPTEICFTLFQRKARITVDQVDLLLLVHKEDSSNEQPGRLVMRSERRCLASVRTNDKFFEPGNYIICCMSLTNFVEEKNIEATIVLHSGKPVEAKLKKTVPETLRQSLVQMTLKEGTPIEYLKDVRLYQISKSFSGLLLMMDNLNEKYCVHVKADCSQSHNILSSRGALMAADCIPPLHRQIILILTHCESSQPFVVQHLLNQRITRQPKLGDFAINFPDSQHDPQLVNPSQVALHGPVPMYI